nr:MAG TPA: hypothetical protein [Caudoviricetes sp.]
MRNRLFGCRITVSFFIHSNLPIHTEVAAPLGFMEPLNVVSTKKERLLPQSPFEPFG